MGRGKIEIKKIENPTNRQVTYSKRRNGIFKKAEELTVLCDAKVSLILLSNTGRFHEYISPSTTTKKMFDQYQKSLGVDLWSTHYDKMQETYRKLKEINNKLKKDIRQRMGEDLEDVTIEELRSLEQNMTTSLATIRERKYHVINSQTVTYNKKVKSLKQIHGMILQEFESKYDDPHYGLVDNGEYQSAVALANGASNLYAFRMQQEAGGYGSNDLTLGNNNY